MKNLLMATTMSVALMAGGAYAQDAGVDTGVGADVGVGVDAGNNGVGVDANADVDADVDTSTSGSDGGVGAGAQTGGSVGTGGTQSDVDTEAGAQTGTATGTQTDDAGAAAGSAGALDGIDAADGFFTDSTRVELRSQEDVMTAFAALTPEEQQLVRERCDGDAMLGDPEDAMTQLCAMIHTQ